MIADALSRISISDLKAMTMTAMTVTTWSQTKAKTNYCTNFTKFVHLQPSISKHLCSFLLDTGAEISILKPNKLSQNEKIRLDDKCIM